MFIPYHVFTDGLVDGSEVVVEEAVTDGAVLEVLGVEAGGLAVPGYQVCHDRPADGHANTIILILHAMYTVHIYFKRFLNRKAHHVIIEICFKASCVLLHNSDKTL